jgi:hypothetical protein
MPLTMEEKNRIQEEETLRMEIRSRMERSRKPLNFDQKFALFLGMIAVLTALAYWSKHW